MKLHPPFLISSALAPALRIGDRWGGDAIVPGTAWLSLLTTAADGREGRVVATFELRTPEFTYTDSHMGSGVGGFHSVVEIFETFLSFLLAAVESMEYEERTGREGENTTLFPRHVVEWAGEHKNDLESLWCELQNEDGSVRQELIEA